MPYNSGRGLSSDRSIWSLNNCITNREIVYKCVITTQSSYAVSWGQNKKKKNPSKTEWGSLEIHAYQRFIFDKHS